MIYRDCEIVRVMIGTTYREYRWSHNDYDGLEDSRHGGGFTAIECKYQIDEMHSTVANKLRESVVKLEAPDG